MSRLLTINGIDAAYGSVEALRGVSLYVDRGQAVAVLGPNGAGKTTLIRCISGQVRPSRGDIRLRDESLMGLLPHRIARRGVVQVPEGREVFAKLTVEENLRIGAHGRRDRGAIGVDVEQMYVRFPVLAERRTRPAGLLSGGEQQMLAIARALMARPELLILDEPSMGLAPKIVQQVFGLLHDLRDNGLTLLVVEQNAPMVLGIADYGYVFERGEVVAKGRADELRERSVEIQAAYLGGR